MATQFNGRLNPSKVFSAMYNVILFERVLDNKAKSNNELVEMAKIDGGLAGDKALFVNTDILGSDIWGEDAEALNLLQLHRPESPTIEEVEVNAYRQIALTTDTILSKQVMTSEGGFNQLQSILEGWIGKTKDCYEAKMFNAFIGTKASTAGAQTVDIPKMTNADPEVANRLQAQEIGRTLANLYVKLADANRDFNNLGNYYSFDKSEMIVVWNSEYVNKILNIDKPTIFNSIPALEGAFKYQLPAHFFGDVLTTGGTTGSDNKTIRSLIEKDYNTVARNKPGYNKRLHVFPGDLLPNSTAYEANEAYEVNADKVFVMYHRNSIPFISAFSIGSNFYNAKSLTTNHYMTWGYSELTTLDGYPFITASINE